MVFGVAGYDLTTPQHRGSVLRLARGTAQARRGSAGGVEVAHDHGPLPAALVGQAPGKVINGVAGRRGERTAQDEILRGVPGERHLGERHQVSPAACGEPYPFAHQVRVCFKISYCGVDLSERDTQLGHGCSLEPKGCAIMFSALPKS